MKKTTLSILIGSLLIGSTLLSCGKYEEGPSISFVPKLVRLQQTWKCVEEVSTSGSATNPLDDGSYIEFGEGGIFKMYDPDYMDPLNLSSVFGTWEFSEDKTQLFINCSFTDPIFGLTINLADVPGMPLPDDTCTIVRLKQNDLGLRDEDGNKYYYVHQ